jgi:RNA polymerase sigma factor (sigma-70 family)
MAVNGREGIIVNVNNDRTSAAIERYLHELADLRGDSRAEPVVRELLGSAVNRLHSICSMMLFGSYPRLARPPLNLQADEMLSSVVERLIKALREVRPKTVREFFGLASQHMRWELNDLARRLDNQVPALELRDSFVPAPMDSSGSQLTPNTRRILEAIESLPEEEKEVFSLVRIQGMTHKEAGDLIGVSEKTIQRRLNRGLVLLTRKLADLQRPTVPSQPK